MKLKEEFYDKEFKGYLVEIKETARYSVLSVICTNMIRLAQRSYTLKTKTIIRRSILRSVRHRDNDNVGLVHIIEHSVLNGSKKYPSKESFVELLKGSLNTFLNAMTYWIRRFIQYRLVTKDSQITDVWLLDAVFYPNFKHDPQILMQEGYNSSYLENVR